MKINVEDIKNIKPNKPLIKAMQSRLECNSLRNLVSYVNNTYPVDGYRYTVHVTPDMIVSISLVSRNL